MAVAWIEHDRAVARAVRREDQPRPARQEMPDRGGRPLGHDDRIELPQKGQGIEQHRQARIAEEAHVTKPAGQALLAEQGGVRREARIGWRDLLDHAQMIGARDGDVDGLPRRGHLRCDGQRMEHMMRLADEEEEDAHQRCSATAASSKFAARQPCFAASRIYLSPRPISQASPASAKVGASLR